MPQWSSTTWSAVGLSEQEFAPRQAVRCLWTLQREVATQGGNAQMVRYRNDVLRLLRNSLAAMA